MAVTSRVVAWNLRASMAAPIIAELCADDSVDVFVLPDYRVAKAGDHVAARLQENGWPHALYSATPPGLKCGDLLRTRHVRGNRTHPRVATGWTGHPAVDRELVSASRRSGGRGYTVQSLDQMNSVATDLFGVDTPRIRVKTALSRWLAYRLANPTEYTGESARLAKMEPLSYLPFAKNEAQFLTVKLGPRRDGNQIPSLLKSRRDSDRHFGNRSRI